MGQRIPALWVNSASAPTHVARTGRIPAHELEQRVLDRLGLFLDHCQAVVDALAVSSDDTTAQTALIAGATAQQVKLAKAAPTEIRQFLTGVVSRITIGEGALEIAVVKSTLRMRLLGSSAPSPSSSDRDNPRDEDTDASLLHLKVAFELRRFSGATHLVVPDGVNPAPAQPQVGLIRALACARRWHEDLLSGHGKSQPQLAKELGVSERYLRKIMPCAFLAPDIVEAILQGRQPADLTLAKLTHRLPNKWADQRRHLAFVGN